MHKALASLQGNAAADDVGDIELDVVWSVVVLDASFESLLLLLLLLLLLVLSSLLFVHHTG